MPDAPAPEPEIADVVPTPPQPDAVVPPQDVTPQPRPVDRVAPVAVAPPPPDTTPDEVARPEISPNDGGEIQQDPQEATAPEEAADRIVTEAEVTKDLAPISSPRPPARPAKRPTPPAPTPPSAANTDSAVNDALAEAMAGSAPASPVPTGPPLTGGEKDALRVAVSSCWNVGSLSSAALQTTVVVGVSMTPDGKPEAASVRMLSSSGWARRGGTTGV